MATPAQRQILDNAAVFLNGKDIRPCRHRLFHTRQGGAPSTRAVTPSNATSNVMYGWQFVTAILPEQINHPYSGPVWTALEQIQAELLAPTTVVVLPDDVRNGIRLDEWRTAISTSLKAFFDIVSRYSTRVTINTCPSVDYTRELYDNPTMANFSRWPDPHPGLKPPSSGTQVSWESFFMPGGVGSSLNAFFCYKDGNPSTEINVERLVGSAFFAPHTVQGSKRSSNRAMGYPPILTCHGSSGSPDFWTYDDGPLPAFPITLSVSDCKHEGTVGDVLYQLASYLHAPLNMLILRFLQDGSPNRALPHWAYIIGCSYTEHVIQIVAHVPQWDMMESADEFGDLVHRGRWSYFSVLLAALPVGGTPKSDYDHVAQAIAAMNRLLSMRRHTVILKEYMKSFVVPPQLAATANIPPSAYTNNAQ